MSDDVFAKLALSRAQKQDTAKKKAAVPTVAASTQEFVITEADIKANPVYAFVTDPNITDQVRLEKLFELKRYNSKLSEAENQKNREAFNEFLLYVENQLMASASKGIDFTNDEAFSLYDETVRELFGNIKVFKGYIVPFLKALEVLQKAREAGIPANELIEGVNEMRANINKMRENMTGKENLVQNLESDLRLFDNEAARISGRLESLNRAVTTERETKATAEKSWNVFGKGKIIADADLEIARIGKLIEVELGNAKSNTERTENAKSRVQTINGEIEAVNGEIVAAQAKFDENEDTQAIATLIEITGDDFKDKRKEVVGAAQTIVQNAVSKIESSIGRFASGKNEASSQLHVISNLNGMVSLLATADRKVRIADGDFIMQQKEIVDRIKAEKGADAVYDPDFEVARKHLEAANEHVTDVNASAARTSALEGKLIHQSGTFKSMRDAYDQKENDATNLRTSAAVDIPAQLAIAVKSVEMATATESNNMVSDAFAELSRTTQQSVSSVFEIVSAGAGHNNEQLRKTMESTMQTIELMNIVEADLRQKTQEGVTVRKSLDDAQRALKEVTGSVASAVVDEENKVMSSQE